MRLQTIVRRIVVENDRACGVELTAARSSAHTELFVAGITPRALPRLVGEALPESVTNQVQEWKFGPGTMTIHLCFPNCPPGEPTRCGGFFYVHVNSRLDQLASAYEQASAGLLPEEPLLVVGQPTVYDSSRAPAGRHTLWIMVRPVPGCVRGDAAQKLSGKRWTDLREPYADRVIELIERQAPACARASWPAAYFRPAIWKRPIRTLWAAIFWRAAITWSNGTTAGRRGKRAATKRRSTDCGRRALPHLARVPWPRRVPELCWRKHCWLDEVAEDRPSCCERFPHVVRLFHQRINGRKTDSAAGRKI